MTAFERFDKYMLVFDLDGVRCTTSWVVTVDELEDRIETVEEHGGEPMEVKATGSSYFDGTETFDIEELREPALQR